MNLEQGDDKNRKWKLKVMKLIIKNDGKWTENQRK